MTSSNTQLPNLDITKLNNSPNIKHFIDGSSGMDNPNYEKIQGNGKSSSIVLTILMFILVIMICYALYNGKYWSRVKERSRK
jgi:hypothetical protein